MRAKGKSSLSGPSSAFTTSDLGTFTTSSTDGKLSAEVKRIFLLYFLSFSLRFSCLCFLVSFYFFNILSFSIHSLKEIKSKFEFCNALEAGEDSYNFISYFPYIVLLVKREVNLTQVSIIIQGLSINQPINNLVILNQTEIYQVCFILWLCFLRISDFFKIRNI